MIVPSPWRDLFNERGIPLSKPGLKQKPNARSAREIGKNGSPRLSDKCTEGEHHPKHPREERIESGATDAPLCLTCAFRKD
jgi:hypothetical protein